MSPASAKQPQCHVTEQQIMVARQPIYNDRMGVFGYELLFRSPGGNSSGLNPTEATAQVLTSTVLDYGLDTFVHNRKAVINVTPAFIEVIQDVQLPPEQVILDLPTNLAADEKLITKLKEIKKLGKDQCFHLPQQCIIMF